jgi:hypothetical protein
MDTSTDEKTLGKGGGFGGAKTISEFCAAWRISRGGFYHMRLRGEAPTILQTGNIMRITRAAEERWIKAREAASRRATKRKDAA